MDDFARGLLFDSMLTVIGLLGLYLYIKINRLEDFMVDLVRRILK